MQIKNVLASRSQTERDLSLWKPHALGKLQLAMLIWHEVPPPNLIED